MLGSLFKSKNQSQEVSDLFSKKLVIEQRPEPVEEEVATNEVQEQDAKQQEEDKVLSDPDRSQRVVFVGNLNINTTSKQLSALFRPYGKVEKVWFRSVPVDRKDKKIPIRAAVIIKQFREGAQSKNGYVLFEEKSSAVESLALNNTLFQDLHIRVDLADKKSKQDVTNTIFIGNVPFTAHEEQIRAAFETPFGEIQSVRLIQDRVSRQGKGFGYIKFKKFVSYKKALLQKSLHYEGRDIRITKAVPLKQEEVVSNNASNAFKRIQKKEIKKETTKIINKKIKKTIKKAKKNQKISNKEVKGKVSKLKKQIKGVVDTNIFNQ